MSVRSIAAEGYYFVATKTKKLISKRLPYTQGHATQRIKPQAGIFCLLTFAQSSPSAKFPMPLPTRKATIVLSAFGRSCLLEKTRIANQEKV